jgi:hypothetical protein
LGTRVLMNFTCVTGVYKAMYLLLTVERCHWSFETTWVFKTKNKQKVKFTLSVCVIKFHSVREWRNSSTRP